MFQRIGLQAQYRDAEPGDQLKKWVRRAASLPLSPVDRLDHVWNETINNAPNIPQAAEFHDYVNRTWMAPDARYSPDIWNIYDRLDDSRTINALEGWHHKLNLYIGKAHPNLFELIRFLKKEELFQRSELGRLGAGGRPNPRRLTYVRLDQRMQRLKTQYENRQRNIMSYVDAVGHIL